MSFGGGWSRYEKQCIANSLVIITVCLFPLFSAFFLILEKQHIQHIHIKKSPGQQTILVRENKHYKTHV